MDKDDVVRMFYYFHFKAKETGLKKLSYLIANVTYY